MKRLIFAILLLGFTGHASALPIDWHGVLGFDFTNISDYQRGVPGGDKDAQWQGTLLNIEPVMIINDAATVKGGLSYGYARGGFLGGNHSHAKGEGFGDSLYQYHFAGDKETLNLHKFYIELYSDTATYLVGRHSIHFGLGAIFNEGSDTWSRFSSLRDGITAKIKIGSFAMEPFWSKQGGQGTMSKSTRVSEQGFSLMYDNIERDLKLGTDVCQKIQCRRQCRLWPGGNGQCQDNRPLF